MFLRNLRSNLSGEDVLKTLTSFKDYKPLEDSGNVFLDRLARANPNAFEEAIHMFSEDTREIIMRAMEKGGWLVHVEIEKAKKIAKKLLLLGDSVEKVAEATELPIDTVLLVANELENLSAVG